MTRSRPRASDRGAAQPDPGAAATVATHFLAPLRRVLGARGLDADAVLQPTGAIAAAGPSRVGYATAVRAWEAAVAATGEPALGLHAARVVTPGDYGVLEYLARASPTLRAALERLGRLHRLLNDGAHVVLSVRGTEARVRYVVPPMPPMPRAYADLVLATWARMCREMTDEPDPFTRVRLPYPRPATQRQVRELRAALAPNLEFDAAHAELFMPRARLNRALPRADVALTATLDRYAEDLLARPATVTRWRPRVADALRARLADGTPRLALVAADVGVKERTLRHHLAHEGTSFAATLDEVRRTSAQALIRDPALSLGEIAFLLGFSEPSAFHRAYRRWTGRTPRPRTA